jgi:hypothetical protein
MNKELNLQVFPREQLKLFNQLSKLDWISVFYLVGRSALALQIGHRQSIYFDFFCAQTINGDELIIKSNEIGKFELFSRDKDTLNASISGVRISFFKSHHALLCKTIAYNKIRITHKFDIALMKLGALSGRGSKKDFIDLFFLMHYFDLADLISNYRIKYGLQLGNDYHLYKSLVYFEDADQQPSPKLLKPVKWDLVKSKIVSEVKKLKI